MKTFQAEDEIAGICSAIGASYAGALAITTTSGPGLSLKSEAIGLAVITELPLVIVDVQRAGPSTGMPTKSEQSDLYQALFGRNGECPCLVMPASAPAACCYAAFEAARLSLEHMTPVILLTDGYIGNGSQLFRIPRIKDLPEIHPPLAQANDTSYQPFARDPQTLVRNGPFRAPKDSVTGWADWKKPMEPEPFPPIRSTIKRWWTSEPKKSRRWPTTSRSRLWRAIPKAIPSL